jgi:hypothetical protein
MLIGQGRNNTSGPAMRMSAERLGAPERKDIGDESEEKPSMPDQPRIVARDLLKEMPVGKKAKGKTLYAKKRKRKCQR